MNSAELTRRLMAAFRPELEEHLTTLNGGLLALEEGSAGELREEVLAEVFRAAHSLKGAARGVGLRDIESVAHALEGILSSLKNGSVIPTPELVDRLLPALDAMRDAMAAHLEGGRLSPARLGALLASLAGVLDRPPPSVAPRVPPGKPPAAARVESAAVSASSAPDPASAHPEARFPAPALESGEAPPAPRPESTVADTIRVPITRLDALMEASGELLAVRMRSERQLAELQTLQRSLTRWSKSWRRARGAVGTLRRAGHDGERAGDASSRLRPVLEFLSFNEASLKAVTAGVSRLAGMAATNLQDLSLAGDAVQDDVRILRLVPASSVVSRFPRMVRDLARESGKDVSFLVAGADLEIDRRGLEAIADPLTHLLRNAVDHGIEDPSVRAAAGKPRRGVVTLRIAQAGGAVIVEVADDGAGIDSSAVLKTALACGAVNAEAASRLSEAEVLQLVFRPGVTTSTKVTDLSGRGVGLDVVRANVERLRGKIAMQTTPGIGTTFTLTVPLALATVHVLLAEVAGLVVAVPTTAVERVLRVNPRGVPSVDGQLALHLDGRPVALLSLAQALGLPEDVRETTDGGTRPAIILGVDVRRRAFLVDSLLGTEEVVVKNLAWPLKRVRNVSGSCILGGGEVGVVLEVTDLMNASPGAAVVGPAVREKHPDRERRVLLVDDSITTRVLEKNILETAGFRVVSASDGEEAWSLMRSEPPEIVVSDVSMPRLDGVGLTQRIRADARLKRIPVVLVTSLATPQDRLRGLEAGADAYLDKGTFDQHELLATIERLLG